MVEQADNNLKQPTSGLTLEGVSKAFGRRRICTDVSLELTGGDRLAVVGPNGSGKTTFLRIIGGLLRPDRGTTNFFVSGKLIPRERWHRHVALVAPELALYDELTALENVDFINQIGGWGKTKTELLTLLGEMGLGGREDDLVGTFSSGMKQRLKYAAAMVKDPALLLLDEPTANFDEAGIEIFKRAIEIQRSTGICIIATNDSEEAKLADRQIVMGG